MGPLVSDGQVPRRRDSRQPRYTVYPSRDFPEEPPNRYMLLASSVPSLAVHGALEVLVDPRSGRIVGSRWADRSPLHALRLLHTQLYLGTRGRVIVGLLGLWLVLQGLTGLYLWWPLMKWPRWGFTVRWARPWPVMGRDLHKALGAAS